MLRKHSLNRLIVLFVAIGFFFLLVDSILEHWDIFSKELWAFIPVVFSFIGFIVGTVTFLQWNNSKIRLLHVLLLATFVVTALGLYFHIKEEDDTEMKVEERQNDKREKEKPLLAPLSFAGLAAIGLLGTSRKWQAEVVE